MEELKRRVESGHSLLERIERAGAAVLLDRGLSKSDLNAAFRLLNPSLASQIVGEAIDIRNEALLLARIRALADRVHNDTYEDDAVSVQLGAVEGPDLETILNRDQLRKSLALFDHELKTASERLETARNAEQARERYLGKQRKHKEIQESLSRYDRYCEDWANRSQVENKIEEVKKAIATTEADVAELDKEIAKAKQREHDNQEEEERIHDCRATLAPGEVNYKTLFTACTSTL